MSVNNALNTPIFWLRNVLKGSWNRGKRRCETNEPEWFSPHDWDVFFCSFVRDGGQLWSTIHSQWSMKSSYIGSQTPASDRQRICFSARWFDIYVGRGNFRGVVLGFYAIVPHKLRVRVTFFAGKKWRLEAKFPWKIIREFACMKRVRRIFVDIFKHQSKRERENVNSMHSYEEIIHFLMLYEI